MAKLVLPTISGGYASITQLNTAFNQIETELQNKVLYRNNPTGEPNQLESDIDMNGHRLLNHLATNGNENFVWRGVWTTGTSYSVNNLVYAPEGTQEGATLICITAHTAGTTLDGDSAYWTVLAARGASGAGTGDVIGPTSSIDNSLARFSGVTGKLLKDGAVIGIDVQAHSSQLDVLSTLSTGISSGNIPLVGTPSATETLAGLVKLATQAEAEAGTNDTVVMTPLKTAQAMTASASSNGELRSVRYYFTSTTWTKPGGLKFVKIKCVGGGGGARAASSNTTSGGAGGGYMENFFAAASLGASETIMVGGGGAGGTTVNANGGAGGTSSFGSLLIAYGGGGSSTVPGIGGTGANGMLIQGENGGPAAGSTTGKGGSSHMGFGAAAMIAGSGASGYTYGGGGSGAHAPGATVVAGGSGAQGIVIVEEYY